MYWAGGQAAGLGPRGRSLRHSMWSFFFSTSFLSGLLHTVKARNFFFIFGGARRSTAIGKLLRCHGPWARKKRRRVSYQKLPIWYNTVLYDRRRADSSGVRATTKRPPKWGTRQRLQRLSLSTSPPKIVPVAITADGTTKVQLSIERWLYQGK